MDSLLGRGGVTKPGTVLVAGLGRFGSATALTLHRLGIDVVAVDADAALVTRFADQLPQVAVMDAQDPEALQQMGADSLDAAVVAIGHLEASILAVIALKDAGVPQVWAKAASRVHGQILEKLGVDHVIYPEADAGERVGHALAGHMIDYFEFEDGFAMARTRTAKSLVGVALRESLVRSRHNVTVVGLKRAGQDFIYAVPETVPQDGDELIVSGPRDQVESFARLT